MAGGEGEGEGGKTLPSVDHALSPRGRGKKSSMLFDNFSPLKAPTEKVL